ncbi:G-protein-signaling modulator 1 isoform X3 [Manis javanica]|uniref:G-protein-signaling modulator 1 isoform X3 n=1 Tax=Manis javanica TaxID=9974 RepID=UPI003C6CF10F
MAGPAPPAADELPGPARRLYSRMEASCLELALEGERLCKAGDFKAGVAFFEAAVQVGTEDLKTLSAIYSQLGNAYFYLKEFVRALEYHRHDLLLARTIGDRMGEAKASGNLGNTLKVLGRFDEATVCCQRHLDIAREQGDKVGEARALYNIGNVYHAKGKQLSWNSAQDPGHLPPDVRETLRRASEFYERNLALVKELGDRAAQGRAYGNLGNTHYLLGSFVEATTFHKERLAIAKEFGDKAAERRAYSNLGNAHIFLGRFDVAAEYYKKTLQLSRQLKDQAGEAQACYSLGNTYTLLQDYERAAEYHLRHLLIAQELADRVGEGRACWSLGNAYVSMGSPAQALTFARKHLEISQEIGDRNGELTARMNVAQLQLALGRLTSPAAAEKPDLAGYEAQGARPKRTQRLSAEAWDLLRLPLERAPERLPEHLHEMGPPHPPSRALGPWAGGMGPELPEAHARPSSPPQEQNGDSHHAGDWRGPARDLLPLPVRGRKYQEGPDAAERGPREGGLCPLDSADVRVQVPRTGSQLRPPRRGGIRGGGASAAEGPWLPQAGLVVARFVCAVCFRQFLDRTLRRRAVNEEARWGAAWCGTAGVPSPGSAPGTPGLAPVENMAGRQVLALPMEKILWQGAETGPSWRPRLDGRLSPLPASFTCRQPRRTWPRAHCGSSRTEGPRRVLRCPLPGAHISCQPPKSPLWLGPARPQGWPDKGRAVSQEGLSLGPARGQLQASQAGRGPRAGGTRLPRVLGPGWAGARGLLHGVLAVPGGRAGRPHGCAESKQGLGWERMPVCPAPPRGSGLKKEGLLQAGAALEGSCRDRPPRPLVWLPQASSTLSAVLGKRVSGCLWGARVCMCVCA